MTIHPPTARLTIPGRTYSDFRKSIIRRSPTVAEDTEGQPTRAGSEGGRTQPCTVAASFQPRLAASWMLVFMPGPPSQKCETPAASWHRENVGPWR